MKTVHRENFIVVNGSATHTIQYLSVVHVESGKSLLARTLVPGGATLPIDVDGNTTNSWDIIFTIDGKQIVKRTEIETAGEDNKGTALKVIILYPDRYVVVSPETELSSGGMY